MTSRYTLFYKGANKPPEEVLKQVRTKVNVLDSSRKTLLVEASDSAMAKLAAELPDWAVEKEYTYPIPSTQPEIKELPQS